MTDANDRPPEQEAHGPSGGTEPRGAFEVPPSGGGAWRPEPGPATAPTWPGIAGGTPAPDPTWPGAPAGGEPAPAGTGTGPAWSPPGTGWQDPAAAPGGGWQHQPAGGGWQAAPAGGWQAQSGHWMPPGAGWAPPSGGWIPTGTGWTPTPPRSPRPMRRSRLVALGVVVAAVVLLLGTGVGYAVRGGGSPSAQAGSQTPGSGSSGLTPFGGSLTPGSTSGGTPGGTSGGTSGSGSSGTGGRSSAAAGSPSNVAAIAAGVDSELVDINTKLKDENEAAAGTGMVLTANGLVLTNNHVIDGATTITATDIGNGKTYQATVVGYDRTHDVAVIQLKDASGLKTVSIGDSSKVAAGEGVVGIGNAGGVGGTPSTAGGSVTALNQSITASDEGSGTSEHLSGLIETNCGIEPGDSGGPLVTTSGQVVGMDTAASEYSGRSGAFAYQTTTTATTSGNQGYSIPIDQAVTLAKKIEAGNGSSTVHIGTTGFLGVEVSPSSSSGTTGLTTGTGSGRGSTSFFGTGFFTTRTSGATGGSVTAGGSGTAPTGADVAGVVPGTPATTAGLGRGDVITTFGGTAVTSSTSLTAAIGGYHPGDHVKVVWVDASGQQHSATVTLANGPAA
ncbi:MAG: trypsin-like peptidase domain-containing protein [Acidimicrobiales bacterium]